MSSPRWTPSAIRFLEERYLVKDEKGNLTETPDQLCDRVGHAVAQGERAFGASDNETLTIGKTFAGLIRDGLFIPNTPTLVNAGRNNGLCLSACFVLNVEDSMDDISAKLTAQMAIQKAGGGTGFSFSQLRPESALVRGTMKESSGPLAFMKIFNAVTEAVKQGGVRRGANMGVLRIDHPDVLAFIRMKNKKGVLTRPDGGTEEVRDMTNFNISLAVTDAFMDALAHHRRYDLIDPQTKTVYRDKAGVPQSLDAEAVWAEVMHCAWLTGDPGLLFIDRGNRSKSNPIPDIELIEASNPCVTGDTLVFTSDGLRPIQELARQNMPFTATLASSMSDGAVQFGPASSPWSSGVKPIFRLVTKEGYEVRCTADHKIMTTNGWVHAEDLRENDQIRLLDHKGGFGIEGTTEEGRVLGWMIGDGTISRDSEYANRAVLSFYGEKREIADDFAQYVNAIVPDGAGKRTTYEVHSHAVSPRNEVRVASTRLATVLRTEYGMTGENKVAALPVVAFQKSEAFQRGLLQALFTADGSPQGSAERGASVRLTSVSLPLLKDVQRMLLNFGIKCTVYEERKAAGTKDFGADRGGVCAIQAIHDLTIASNSLAIFANEIGFLTATKRAKLAEILASYRKGFYHQPYTARFDRLIPDGNEEVYDLTEGYTHSFVANGIVVSNCGEQLLLNFDSCNLGSIVVSEFVIEEPPDNPDTDSWGTGFDWERFRDVAKHQSLPPPRNQEALG
jgi:ribonucleoside-diphosphate reductase alpha chain